MKTDNKAHSSWVSKDPSKWDDIGINRCHRRWAKIWHSQYPLYNQMTERYNPNLTAPQYQPPPTRTSFRPSTPATCTQAKHWSAMLPHQQYQRPGQSFQPRVAPPSQRNMNSNSLLGMNVPGGPFREHGFSPQIPAPYPEPYISPYKVVTLALPTSMDNRKKIGFDFLEQQT